MKNITTHTGTLQVTGRLPSSVNGNPRFSLFVFETDSHGVSCVTAPDSMIAYGITNFVGKKVEVTIGTHYGRATLNSIKEV